MSFRAENRDKGRYAEATGPSEDCGKRHGKISTADGVDWIVRGDGVAGGWSGPSTTASAGANPNASAGAGSSTATANPSRPAEHS